MTRFFTMEGKRRAVALDGSRVKMPHSESISNTVWCKLVAWIPVTAHLFVLSVQHQCLECVEICHCALSEMEPQTLIWKVMPPLKSPGTQKYSS